MLVRLGSVERMFDVGAFVPDHGPPPSTAHTSPDDEHVRNVPALKIGKRHQRDVLDATGATRMIRLPAHLVLACCLTLAAITSALAADIEKGKVVFERCAACHSLEAGKNEDAPTLRGLFGRKIASIEEFRYSAAMKRRDVVWTQRTLDTFIDDPQAFIPGNRMPFDGLKDKSEREDLLAYLEVATKTARAYWFKLVLWWAAEIATTQLPS